MIDFNDELGPDDHVRLAGWVPPWRDNGARLLEMVEGLREMDDEGCWQVICVLLADQLRADITLQRTINALEAAEEQARYN